MISGFLGCGFLSMGALDEGHFNAELKGNGVKLGGCIELGFEEERETTVAIEDAVKVLLQGLGEDINREGLRKTPLRVAKALREGTRGMPSPSLSLSPHFLTPLVGFLFHHLITCFLCLDLKLCW